MRRKLATVGWGLFCASSWTWCIGMYLPVLLLRHFGWPGALAFVVPNVAGCVAFGYVLGDRSSARRLTEKHAWACGLFSLVTVAYHLFFAAFVGAYLIPSFSSPLLVAVLAAVALYAAGLGLSRITDRAWPVVAILVYCISILAFVCLGAEPLSQIGWQGNLDGWRLAFLAPSLAFGFLLCPYLDLTFHRALLESPSRHAFAVFGAAFSVIVLLTCVYWDAASNGLATAALVHISVQAVFTVAVHLRELRGWVTSTTSGVRWLVWTAPFAAVPFALVPLAWEDPLPTAEGMYLRLLVFYGLVFPLYVLLFLGRRPVFEASRRSLLIFAGLVLLAAPFYELGFLHEKTWFLLISLGAILAGVAFLRITRRRDHEGPAAGPPIAPAASATQSKRRASVTGT